jgi:putative aldouronate transport system substrate-binding protein
LGSDAALPGRDLIWRGKDNASGKLYSIPSRRMNVAQRNTFIRKDWLDKLGLPLPKTTQEFYDALVAFKEKDPGNVGKNKAIPFTLNAETRWSASTVLDAFIDPKISDKERWINTVAERSFMVPGYKEGLRFLNKMYNDGLVDRDFPLYSNEDTYKNLIKSGVVGAFTGEWDRIFRESDALFTDLLKNVPTGNWVPVDCMTSSDGITHKGAYDAAGVLYFIPASSKNPDAAMRYLNWLSKYENYHFLQVGTVGIVHTLENGVPKVNPMAGGGWIQNSPLNIDYTIPINGLNLGSEAQNIKAIAAGYPWPPELVTAAYNISMTNARPSIVVSPSSPLTIAGPLEQTLISKGTVIYTQSITAPRANFDRVYDAGIADWLISGAQSIIDERRAKYVAP